MTTRAGAEVAIDAAAGISVMESMRNAGLDEVLALCGGFCSCATCHVFVDEKWLPQVGAAAGDELASLQSSTPGNSRLSCQVDMTDEFNGLHVSVAPED